MNIPLITHQQQIQPYEVHHLFGMVLNLDLSKQSLQIPWIFATYLSFSLPQNVTMFEQQ